MVGKNKLSEFACLFYSKSCLKRPLKKKTKVGFKTNSRLMHSAILLTFIKLPFALFCVFLSGRLRQAILYLQVYDD